MVQQTRGFGFDEDGSPYHFVLIIPRSQAGVVAIEERWLIERGAQAALRPPMRLAELARSAWDALGAPVRDDFNRRLKRDGMRGGEFHEGDNLMAPHFGKELVLLLWAAERADPEQLDTIVANWRGLAPEERWWLFTTADASRDHHEHGPDRGWRKAIKIAFAENPVIAAPAGKRPRKAQPAPAKEVRTSRRGKKSPAAEADPTQQLSLLEES